MLMGHKEQVLCHSTNSWILLRQFMILEFRIKRYPGVHVKNHLPETKVVLTGQDQLCMGAYDVELLIETSVTQRMKGAPLEIHRSDTTLLHACCQQIGLPAVNEGYIRSRITLL